MSEEYRPGIKAQNIINDFTESIMRDFPRQLGIPEVIPGCEVTSLDPYGAGIATFPRYITIRIANYTVPALYRGSPILAVGDKCEIIHVREGDVYIVVSTSGAGGVEFVAEPYRWHWVYDVSEATLLAYDTIAGALAYAALTSGDYVLTAPGVFDESITLVDGVIIAEQIPGATIIHSTSASTAVTCADGGYIQVKEIQCTRSGNNATAVYCSMGATDTCEIRAELIKATGSNDVGGENIYGVHIEGGILTIHADVEAQLASDGNASENIAIKAEGGTLYQFGNIDATLTGLAISYNMGIEASGSTIYVRGHINTSGDDYTGCIYASGASDVTVWGDCRSTTVVAASETNVIETSSNSAITVYGNCEGVAVQTARGAWIAGEISVFGRLTGETTGGAAINTYGAEVLNAAAVARIHGDCISTAIFGNSIGLKVSAGIAIMTCGMASGSTYDLSRSGGTLRVSMVDFDTYNGTITQYYPCVDDAWIGIAGGAGARLNFDDTPAPDVADFANCRLDVNEASPDRRFHAAEKDAVTNAVTYVERLTHECSTGGTGLAANGGAGQEFELETATDGTNRVAGTIEVAWSDPAAATSQSRLQLRTDYQGNSVLSAVIESPNAASADGNARGVGAVDLQGNRNAVTQVASGGNAGLVAGARNTASGSYAFAGAGYQNTVSGDRAAIVGGLGSTISGDNAGILAGNANTASADLSAVIAGLQALADKYGQVVNSAGRFGANGDAQGTIQICARLGQASHAVNTWYALYPDGGGTPERITISASTCWTVHVKLVGITADCAQRWNYIIEGNIYQDAAGNTAVDAYLLTSIFESDANYEARIAADDANEALEVQVRRTAGTDYDVYWHATISMSEVTRAS